MRLYTFQVSNHPLALEHERPITEAAASVWETLYDGPMQSDSEARKTAQKLMAWYRHVRVFRGGRTTGRLWIEH